MTAASPLVHRPLPLSGWIILDKPVGLGSTQAVVAVKRALREAGEAKTKVGHGGTLDPLASGVLPIALGEATKLCGRMLDATKAYDFTIRFGEKTSTLDAEGEVVERSDVRPSLEQMEQVLPRFTGPIEQTPPAYSALKVDGQRAYALARAGESVELAPREVTIHSLAAESFDGDHATLAVACSKGTYVRSLARDLAKALGTVGHVSMLRRTKAGPFVEAQAISLDKLEALGHSRALERALLPLTAGLDDIPVLAVDPAEAAMLRQGRFLRGRSAEPGLHLATDGPVPVALVDVSADEVRVVRGFNL